MNHLPNHPLRPVQCNVLAGKAAKYLRALFAALVLVGMGRTAVAADPVAVIVGPKNSVSNLPVADLASIYRGEKKYWSAGQRIVALNLVEKHSVRLRFEKAILKMSPEEVERYWMGQKIRGKARPPKIVPNVEVLQKLVAVMPGAIGFVPLSALDAKLVKTVSLDGKKAGDSGYVLAK